MKMETWWIQDGAVPRALLAFMAGPTSKTAMIPFEISAFDTEEETLEITIGSADGDQLAVRPIKRPAGGFFELYSK